MGFCFLLLLGAQAKLHALAGEARPLAQPALLARVEVLAGARGLEDALCVDVLVAPALRDDLRARVATALELVEALARLGDLLRLLAATEPEGSLELALVGVRSLLDGLGALDVLLLYQLLLCQAGRALSERLLLELGEHAIVGPVAPGVKVALEDGVERECR